MAEKVRIMAWKEEGIPSTATEGRLCRHCTSKKASSLRQGVFPLTQSLRDKKNGPATCQLSKDMETKCVKKRDLMSYHQEEGIPAGRLLSPPDKFSIQAHFLFPKTEVIRQCYGFVLPFFS
jgi:hypothetical protein